jgi:Nif11 domain
MLDNVLFACFLLILIISFLSLLIYDSPSLPKINNSDRNLEKFYTLVSQDSSLSRQIEEIIDREDFITQIVKIGTTLDYRFSELDVQNSLEKITPSGQDRYFCLPIGCWYC